MAEVHAIFRELEKEGNKKPPGASGKLWDKWDKQMKQKKSIKNIATQRGENEKLVKRAKAVARKLTKLWGKYLKSLCPEMDAAKSKMKAGREEMYVDIEKAQRVLGQLKEKIGAQGETADAVIDKAGCLVMQCCWKSMATNTYLSPYPVDTLPWQPGCGRHWWHAGQHRGFY